MVPPPPVDRSAQESLEIARLGIETRLTVFNERLTRLEERNDRLVRLEERIDQVRIELGSIKNTFRWIAVTLGGAVLVAVGQWMINGGLAGV